MAITAFFYGNALKNMNLGLIDFENGDVRVALLDNGYTPAQDTDEFWDDVSANEVSGDGYDAEGALLGTPTLTYTGGTNILKFSGANVTWPASTITAAFAVVYLDSGTPGTSPLISYVDFGGDVSTSAGTFQITWDAAGIAKITVA